jgi:hypothetical protein
VNRWWLAKAALSLLTVAVSGQPRSVWAGAAKDQGRTTPTAFRKLRFEEDYSQLRGQPLSWLERPKYIPLSDDGRFYLSLGGELRLQYTYLFNPDWGETEEDEVGALFSRIHLHADLHLTRWVRVFVQFRAAFETGRRGPESPLDEDRLDLHQGFVDLNLPLASSRQLLLRVGRQELTYGSARLVDVREGPNVRRSFDAALLSVRLAFAQLDAFYAQPVATEVGLFDNRFQTEVQLWGMYASVPLGSSGFALEPYYLGLANSQASYANASGSERRHSLGLRLSGRRGWVDTNIETVVQLGEVAEQSILAWTAASDTGVTLPLPLEPRIGLRLDVASGDGDPDDDRLGTFNALFPRGNYFGQLVLFGPSNFWDVHPFVSLKLPGEIGINADWGFFWRLRDTDAIYNPGGGILLAPGPADSSRVGSQLAIDIEWQITHNLSANAQYAHFFPSSVVGSQTRGRSVDLVQFTFRALL